MQGSEKMRQREHRYGLSLAARGLRHVVTLARGALTTGGMHPDRGRLLREILSLDVVAGGGQTPNGYGWHVDDLLNVGLHYANEPLVPAGETPVEDGGVADQVPIPKLYRVPRTARSQPRLQLEGAP